MCEGSFRAGLRTCMHPHSLSPSPAVLELDTESLSLHMEASVAADQPRTRQG